MPPVGELGASTTMDSRLRGNDVLESEWRRRGAAVAWGLQGLVAAEDDVGGAGGEEADGHHAHDLVELAFQSDGVDD